MSDIDLKSYVYAPYSHKEQWCIVEGKKGVLYPGVHIENASFPLTITASQVALFTCLSEGDIPRSIYVPDQFHDDRLRYLTEYHQIDILSTHDLPVIPLYHAAQDYEDPIDVNLQKLIDRAIVGESHFRVACILELETGGRITGVNIEYPDWQIGLCAERVAISKAIASGLIHKVNGIHITASSGSFISPCGACRQVLVEHAPYKSIHLHHPDGTESSTNAAQLLPAFFNGSTLRK
jgi:homotetrameric cytidine deaminase